MFYKYLRTTVASVLKTRRMASILCTVLLTLSQSGAWAQSLAASSASKFLQLPYIKIENVWAQATLPGQQVSAAFLTLTASQPGQLLAVSSPIAGRTEIHSMNMDAQGVMRMRAIEALDLEVNKVTQLKPGGYHVMLFDLKQPLVSGQKIPLQITLKMSKLSEPQVLTLLAIVKAPEAH